jgi:peptide/nickel transport system permease protein
MRIASAWPWLLAALMLAATLLAPPPFDPTAMDFDQVMTAPGWPHVMGTDNFGRDVFSRVLLAGRPALLLSLAITALSALIGVPLGVVAGYLGGWPDLALMRVLEVGFTFPPLVLAIAIIGVLGAGLPNLVLALVCVYAPLLARIARGATLSVRRELYVAAAIACGDSRWSIMAGQVLPNIAGTLLIQASLVFCYALLSEASLSFIGLGTQPDNPSWGRLLSEAIPLTAVAPWLGIFPGLAIVLTVALVNLGADRLGDAAERQ